MREDILNTLPTFHCLTKLELNDCHVHLESRALLLLLSRCHVLKSLRFSGVIIQSLILFPPIFLYGISVTAVEIMVKAH